MTQLAPYIWHLDSCPAPAHVAECNCGYAAAKAMAEKADALRNEPVGVAGIIAERLDEIEQRTNTATAGPWVDSYTPSHGRMTRSTSTGRTVLSSNSGLGYHMSDEDITFVTNSRTDVPDLISCVRQLQKQNETLQLYFDDADAEREKLQSQLACVDHALYLALIPVVEHRLHLEPFPATTLASEIAADVMEYLPALGSELQDLVALAGLASVRENGLSVSSGQGEKADKAEPEA